MTQFFGIEEIKELTKTSQTTLEWASGSFLRIAGQGYNISSALVLNLATDIDTGSVSNDTIYYVYAIVNSGSVILKYSLSSSAPTGFSAYRKIGSFRTDGSAELLGTSIKDQGRVGDVIHSMLTEEQFLLENGAGWVLADGRSVAGTKYAAITGNSTIPDMRGQFLRGKNNNRSDGNQDKGGERALGNSQLDQVGPISGKGGNFSIYSASGNQAAGFEIFNGAWQQYAYTHNAANETRPKNVVVNIFIKIEDVII